MGGLGPRCSILGHSPSEPSLLMPKTFRVTRIVLDHMLTAAQETGLAEEQHLSLLCGDQGGKMLPSVGLNQVSYSPGWLTRVK